MRSLAVLCVLVALTSAAELPLDGFDYDSGAEDRIVGGHLAGPQATPFVASIRETCDSFGCHVCTGSILSSTWILTAGTCCRDPTRFYRIVVGEYDTYNEQNTTQLVHALNIVNHENYTYDTKANDICVIETDAPIDLSHPWVQPVTLPPQDMETFPGEFLTMAGWGELISGTSAYTEYLRAVDVMAADDAICRSTMGPTVNEAQVLCTDHDGGTKGMCNGDEGGPLVNVGSFQQVGIVSWSRGCAGVGWYDVNTQVSHYVDWICTATGGQICP